MTPIDMMLAVQARIALAGVRESAPKIEDADIARPIYTELLRLAREMSKQHHFAYHEKNPEPSIIEINERMLNL